MNIFDTKLKKISGPINVIRMEGMAHGIKKVIYLFMDYHEDVAMQTECINVFSKDLNKYLAENFYNLNNSPITYDFFMEVRPSDILLPPNMGTEYLIYKKQYISQVIKFFASVFKYDPDKDIVRISDIFKNVRLHYLDIRDYLKYHVIDFLGEAGHLCHEFMCNQDIPLSHLSQVINILKTAKLNLDNTVKIFKSGTKPVDKPVDKKVDKPVDKKVDKKVPVIKYYKGFEQETVERLVFKIKQSYKHTDVKNILVPMLEKSITDLEQLSNNIDTTIQSLTEHGNFINDNFAKLIKEPSDVDYHYGINSHNMRKIIFDIINSVSNLYQLCVKIFARITDIYMLRRFLDKDYITNAIVYSGAAHSEMYVKTLIAYFGFKITHVSFSSIENLDTLNKEIKSKAQNNINITEMINPPLLYQCADVTNFPDKFL